MVLNNTLQTHRISINLPVLNDIITTSRTVKDLNWGFFLPKSLNQAIIQKTKTYSTAYYNILDIAEVHSSFIPIPILDLLIISHDLHQHMESAVVMEL